MPRYQYRCTGCEEIITLAHLSNEVITECPQCSAPRGLVKLLTRFSTRPKVTVTKKTGQVTEDFIKDARQELKQQKQKTPESK